MAPKLSESAFQHFIADAAACLDSAGFSVEERRPIDYGVSLCLRGGGMLNLYNGKKGASAVPAGKLGEAERAALLASIAGLLAGTGGAAAPGEKPAVVNGPSPAPTNSLGLAEPWIGCDEAGKGDFFGPLVVAAVLVAPEHVQTMVEAGVRDGKRLSANRAITLSGWIEREFPCATRVVMPVEYNRRYDGNLNHMLSDLHAEVIGELAAQGPGKRNASPRRSHAPARHAISDRFGNPARIVRRLREAGANVALTSVTRAESDIAVAAAGVLARGLFLQSLKELSARATLTLPPGAGPQVVKAGRELAALLGADGLNEYVKQHFKTSDAVLGRTTEKAESPRRR